MLGVVNNDSPGRGMMQAVAGDPKKVRSPAWSSSLQHTLLGQPETLRIRGFFGKTAPIQPLKPRWNCRAVFLANVRPRSVDRPEASRRILLRGRVMWRFGHRSTDVFGNYKSSRTYFLTNTGRRM